MKYQDGTMENAFWSQLLEIEHEWISCEMVGTLSSKAFQKTNLNTIHSIILDRKKWESGYYHFIDTNNPIPSHYHPNLLKIAVDIVKKLGVPLPTENCCNYWMCRPVYMKQFIPWFHSTLKPLVFNHPLALTDAKYGYPALSLKECYKLFGVPYYPHTIFVIERLNKIFFTNIEKFCKPNVKLYILCHTEERLHQAREIYSKYGWAVPILMKYQDGTMENAFWKQLLEIEHEWMSCEMVGTLSFSAYKKINLDIVDCIIQSREIWKSGYYHFNDHPREMGCDMHPHLTQIAKDVLSVLGLPLPTENWCNYWMCKPHYMKEFIDWYTCVLKPLVMNHPLAFTDATYTQSKMSVEECKKTFGTPYYPHYIFVIERLNKVFFMNREKILAFKQNPAVQKLQEQPKKQETDS
jgi:hypothetical protein